MTRLYYPLSSLWPDYLRAGIGLSISAGLQLFASPQSVIFMVLTGLSLLFAWLGASTLWRQQIEIELDATGIVQTSRWRSGWRRVVPWSEITAVSLRYFSTRRDRSQGWWQLTIRGHRGQVRADNGLTEFPSLVQQAIAAAARNGATMNAATRANAAQLGLLPVVPPETQL
jgi:hypothetical protein